LIDNERVFAQLQADVADTRSSRRSEGRLAVAVANRGMRGYGTTAHGVKRPFAA